MSKDSSGTDFSVHMAFVMLEGVYGSRGMWSCPYLVLWAHKEEFRGVGPLALPYAEGISLNLDLLFYFLITGS